MIKSSAVKGKVHAHLIRTRVAIEMHPALLLKAAGFDANVGQTEKLDDWSQIILHCSQESCCPGLHCRFAIDKPASRTTYMAGD